VTRSPARESAPDLYRARSDLRVEALLATLTLDAPRSLGKDLEPLFRDWTTAVLADPVNPPPQSAQGVFDRGCVKLELLLACEHAFPSEEVRRDIGRMLRGRDVLATALGVDGELDSLSSDLVGEIVSKRFEALFELYCHRRRECPLFRSPRRARGPALWGHSALPRVRPPD
jgi:hypothetical protein